MQTVRFRTAVGVVGLLSLLLSPNSARADIESDFAALRERYESSYRAGRGEQALAAAQEIVTLAERSFTDRPDIMAYAYKSLANVYGRMGKPAQALGPMKQCLPYAERRWGADSSEALDIVGATASISLELGRFQEALPLFERVLATQEKTLDARDMRLASTLNQLGSCCLQVGQVEQGAAHLKRCLKILESAMKPNVQAIAAVTGNLGASYRHLGKHDEAAVAFRRALEVVEGGGGGESLTAANLEQNLATLYYDQARFADAEAASRRAVTLFEKHLAVDDPQLGLPISNLANILAATGRMAEAEPLFLRSISIWEAKNPSNPNLGIALDGLALLCVNQQRFAEADDYYRRARAIIEKSLGPKSVALATNLSAHGNLCREQRRFEEAEQLLTDAVAIKERNFGDEHPSVAMSLFNLAQVYEARKDRQAAETYERCLKIWRSAYGQEYPYVALALAGQGSLLGREGKIPEAIALFTQAIDICTRTGAAPGQLAALHGERAAIHKKSERKDEALKDLQRAIDLAETQRTASSGSEREMSLSFVRYRDHYERMIEWRTELDDVEEAWKACERSRARSLLDQMQLAGADLLAGLPVAEAESLRARRAKSDERISSVKRRIESAWSDNKLIGEARTKRLRELDDELRTAVAEAEQIYREVRTVSPAYRLAVASSLETVGLSELQKHLSTGHGMLVSFFVGEQGVYRFTVPHDGKPRVDVIVLDDAQARELDLPAGRLTAATLTKALTIGERSVVERMSEEDSSPELHARLRSLGKVLFDDAIRSGLTDGTIKALTIVPDGPLAELPFETLVMNVDGEPEYLLDVGPPLIYAPSATILLNLAQRRATPPQRNPILSIASAQAVTAGGDQTPTLDLLVERTRFASTVGKLAPLYNVETESSWVSSVFEKAGIKATALVGSKANEAQVREAVSGRLILHFACHGIVDRRSDNLCGGLVLENVAPDGGVLNDGFLSLAEIYELNLRGSELTILSACETNRGPNRQGEGVWAVSRGCLVAGTRRVAATNWTVDDEATASLVSYYCSALAEQMKNGGSPNYAVALHEAKQWLRKQAKWKAPYYWAPTVLVGPS